MKHPFLLTAALLFSPVLFAQTALPPAAHNPDFGEVVDHAIFQENSLLKILFAEQPIAETYIQDMRPDSDFGSVPQSDHYFLGKLDFSHGINEASFIPKIKTKTKTLDMFNHMFSVEFLPRGFAQMILIDGGEFDRNHYDFEFVRREILGDVRTWVINVSPKKTAGNGRFIGRIWVEDKDFNVVRFNGTYGPAKSGQFFMHFDSWRVNCGPDLWMPYETYSEESSLAYALKLRSLSFKAITHIWGYTTPEQRKETEFTNMSVDVVKDSSAQTADNSPVESLREWERESEDNVLDRLEKANMLAPRGEVEKILNTVITNVAVTNNLDITPEVRARVLLTTPLESFTIGHTIVISRGLLDTLPDEASLAALLTHELAHIALGQVTDTKFAFSDRVIFDDVATLEKFRFIRPQAEEDAANEKAVQFLENSPYKDKLSQAGLFLKALAAQSDRLPSLVKPLFGNRMAEGSHMLRLAGLLDKAPELQRTRVDQVSALPLGGRTSLDPWDNTIRMTRVRVVPLLSARERMPFELTPISLHLRYQGTPEPLATDGNTAAAEPATPPAQGVEARR